jgi:GWxTD domain-containing protein
VYDLTVSVKSKDLQTTYASRTERFYILNPELPPEGELLLSEDQRFFASEWSQKTGDQLELELELARVIASNAEKTTMEGLESNRAKQRFLFKFWDSRDPDPSTLSNERLDDFRKMYQRAQAFYTSAMVRDGWRTDRGVTLLKYGLPTQIEQFIQTMDTKPYEIWFYQGVQGGAYFYFVDWQVMQNHKLVHCTVIGEVKDDNWFNRWARAFSPDPNPVHQQLPSAR